MKAQLLTAPRESPAQRFDSILTLGRGSCNPISSTDTGDSHSIARMPGALEREMM